LLAIAVERDAVHRLLVPAEGGDDFFWLVGFLSNDTTQTDNEREQNRTNA